MFRKNTAGSAVATAAAAALLLTVAQPASAADVSEASEAAASIVNITGVRDIVKTATTDQNSAAIVSTQAGTVDIPVSTAGEVTLGSGSQQVGLGLPDLSSKPAVRDIDGTVVYADASKPADIAVQPVHQGFRALVTIKNNTASHEYRFPVDVPEGGRLVSSAELLGSENATGEILIADAEGRIVSGIDAAWAKDANGDAVPSRYRIEGSTVIQEVDFTENTAFPVVADPSLWAITKCVASITWFIGSNVVSVAKLLKIKKYISALGGIRKSAELLLRASNWEERMRIGGGALVGLASEFLGVASVKSNCFD